MADYCPDGRLPHEHQDRGEIRPENFEHSYQSYIIRRILLNGIEHMNERLKESIRAVLENGQRLLNDVSWLKIDEPPSTAYFLTLIAQEEFAKAFLLELVRRQLIPWNNHIFRATRDHKCKQLVCIVMDYLSPNVDEFLERCNPARHERSTFPAKVADAITILRYEKIGRWESGTWVWAENPEYDRDAQSIADGWQEAQKQDAIYVRLNKNGSLASTPANITTMIVQREIERAERHADLIKNLLKDIAYPAIDYSQVEEAFRPLFTVAADQNNADT